MVLSLKNRIKQWFQSDAAQQSEPLDGKYYRREGYCNGCGKCCTGIHLVHGKKTIDTVEEFERLKRQWADYESFKPVDVVEDGVVFQCVHLQDDNQCGIYENRPSFCRSFPSEAAILLGSKIPADCSYMFTVKKSFQQVLNQSQQKPTGQPGRLVTS